MKARILILELAAVASLTVARADLTNDLVVWYLFSGNALDASGNGNDGTVSGATLTTDRVGHTNAAYAFPGTALSRITVNSANLLLQPPFSCSVWVNFSGGTQDPRIFSEWGWEITTTGTGSTRRFDFNNYTTSGFYDCLSSNVFPQGIWHHVVAVRSPDAMLLYVDGRLQGNVAVADPVAYSAGLGTVWIPTIGGGAGIGYPYDAFGGSLDDVRVYSRALSGQEIAALYAEELEINPSLLPASGLRVHFQTVTGQKYQLQASSDLITWTNVSSPIQGDGGVWSLPCTLQGPQLFYRLGKAP
jgi:hypothetical protein